MFSYEVTCSSCRQKFHLLEGTLQYKLLKEKKSKIFTCEDCSHKIRIEAIRNFLSKL